MAILDSKLELMDAASIAGAPAATATSEILDFGLGTDCWDQSKTPDVGEGGDLWLNIRVATTIASSGSTPIATVRAYTHTAAGVSSGTLLLTQVIGSDLSAGADVLRVKIPAGTISRYFGLVTTIGATTITAGALDVWLGLDSESPLTTT